MQIKSQRIGWTRITPAISLRVGSTLCDVESEDVDKVGPGAYDLRNGPPKAMIKVAPLNHLRFAVRSFLNVAPSARSFSSQNVAPLLVNPLNVTKDAIFVDASWHMPNSPRKAREEFLKKRLPQARFLDLDEVAKEHELGLKHMIPDPKVFAKYCGEYLTNTWALAILSLPATDTLCYILERSGISRTSPVIL